VKKAGDTMTGTLTSASTTGSIVFKGVENSDITNIYKSGLLVILSHCTARSPDALITLVS
jgi:hypothetical protein